MRGMAGMRYKPSELAVITLVVFLTVAPTVALCAMGVLILRRAEGAYERDVRQAYSQAASSMLSECLAQLRATIEDVGRQAGEFAADPSPDARLALDVNAVPLAAVALLDGEHRPLYPSSAVQSYGGLLSTDSRIEDASRREATDGAAAALIMYEAILESAPAPEVEQAALSGAARCLAALGRTGEAVSAWERLAAMDWDGRGDLSLPLLGRLRAWELSPSSERLAALLADCSAAALTAPEGQVRYCLDKTREDAAPEVAAARARLEYVLALRRQDGRAADVARIAAEGDAPQWRWRALPIGDGWQLAGALRYERRDGTVGFVVALADAPSLASTVIGPALARAAAGGQTKYVLAVEPSYGRFVEEPLKPDLVAAARFPSPFDFWTIEVYSSSGEVQAVARGRAVLMYWALILCGAALLSGVATALIWARRRARLANMQTDFVANVTHELKTPLTSIQGFAQAILDRTAGDEAKRQQAARIIYDEAGRMHRMVLDLLDLARLDAGTLDLQRAQVDLLALINDTVEKFTTQARQAGVTLRVDTEALPPITGDGDRLAQVFTNLVDNALKFTPPGGQISLRASPSDDFVAISISDSGAGIPTEAIPHIFERFYQADPSRKGGERHGSGLGLAIAREIVQAYGGEISVESEPGRGSTFRVRLPRTVSGATTVLSKRRK